MSEESSTTAASTAPDNGSTVPAVVAVVVTHDPGPWFETVLESLRDQTYDALSVLVVDTASEEDPTPRVAAVLPTARVKRLDHDPGFGAAANQVLDVVQGAAFHLVCHDDVALAPNAVRLLVEEAFRTNGGVLGPKLVDWHDPRRIRSAGGAIDKTGSPAPHVDPGELDQEQHDGVRDVFYVSGGAMLIRADLFATLGGFDPEVTIHGDDIDLCWRAHVAGARVVIVPEARARHLEALGERRPDDDRRRLQQRHRVRSMLTAYGRWHRIRVVPQALAISLVELIVAVLSGRWRHARDIVGAWTWNLRRSGSLRRRRREIAGIRTVGDSEVRDLQVRGSARLTAFLRGQLGSADDRLAGLAATGRDLSAILRAPLTRVAVGGAVVTLGLMVVGTRNLLFQPLPSVGDLAAFPDSPFDLLRSHLSGWRTTAGGGPGWSPTGVGASGVVGLLTLGSMGAARKLLVFGLLAAGPVGIWRLSRPIGSVRAGAAAVIVYSAIPVPYNALASGTWSALAAYAVVPWIFLGLARTMGLAPYGPTDLPEDTKIVVDSVTSIPARGVGIGLAVAIGASASPALLPLTVLIVVGLALGSLVAGRVAGVGRMVAAGALGLVVAVLLHLPWTVSLVADGGGWDAVMGADVVSPRPIAELLRFQTGPFGNTPMGWAFLVAAALPLVIGRGWRLAWGVRAWFVALVVWGVLLAGEQGHLPVSMPPPELLLVPAAVGLALSAALGMAAFEVDLRHFGFGWRQAVSIIAAAAVLVGGMTLAPGIVDGRWRVPGGDLNRVVAPTLTADGDEDARILWLGDPSVLPVGGHRYDDEVSIGTSDGLPDVRHRWAGPRQAATDRLLHAVEVARDGRTGRLGSLLAAEGIRYVAVPTRSVPYAYRGRSAEPPSWVTDVLAAQLDLQQVDTDLSVLLFRNEAWRDMAYTVPAEVELGDRPTDAADPALRDVDTVVTSRPDDDTIRIDIEGGDGDVVAAVPADGWTLDDEEGEPAFGWAGRFASDDAGRATLSFATSPLHVALVLAQPVLWLLALGIRGRLVRSARDRLAAAAPPDDGPVAVVDPVEQAAAAVAGLAARSRDGDGGVRDRDRGDGSS